MPNADKLTDAKLPETHLPKAVTFTFETERLYCRLLNANDKDFFIALHTNEKIMKYSGGAISEHAAIKKFNLALKANIKTNNNFRTWAILSKQTNAIIGIQVLFVSANCTDDATLEIGIMLSRTAQGKLLPEEAMGALMEFAFTSLNIKKIIAEFDQKNLATKRFVTKLGFNFLSSNIDSATIKISFNSCHWQKTLLL
ncbi:GNAT family N-acetyltransferase [Colwellia sp. MEBiC06753]